ncbi:MAG: dicarboxylate/amino acid:cation symporter [Clostridiales bacterium]|nr:dicarboxylate/amino acid:cation symporter [Clostridiales bacterium]
MLKIIKNQQIQLIVGIIFGMIIGLFFKERVLLIKPIGEAFINLLIICTIPFMFFSITYTISNMTKNKKRMGRITKSIVKYFIISSLIAVAYGFIITRFVPLTTGENLTANVIINNQSDNIDEVNYINIITETIITDDFLNIFSKNNIVALIAFSILFGIAVGKSEENDTVKNLLKEGTEIFIKLTEIIMKFAPIGLGCYFASLMAELGGNIAIDYIRTLVIYTITATVFYIVIYSVYAFLSKGKNGVVTFWKNTLPLTLMALTTCSSSACIPKSIETTKKLGVNEDVATTSISLGTVFHKDGSLIGAVFKIMFLVYLFNTNISSLPIIIKIVFIAIVASLLVTAVPITSGTADEIFMLTLMGYSLNCLPILMVIATIIDIPATILNVIGNVSVSMLINKDVNEDKKVILNPEG